MYQLYYYKQAEKFLSRQPKTVAQKILNRLELLSSNPFRADNNISKLKETVASYRLRLGNIRVIYIVNSDKLKLYIHKISFRGSAYTA